MATTAIWWIRRDLRLTDNPALTAALSAGEQLIPLFIIDPALVNSEYVGANRLAFLYDGLRALAADLHSRGGQLIVRQGDPLTVLQQLVSASGAAAIFAEADVSPFARRRDARVAARLTLRLTAGASVFPPDAVLKADGTPYTVFTPFSKAWKALPAPQPADLLAAPAQISAPPGLPTESIPAAPALPKDIPFPAGEAEARRRLEKFEGQMQQYGDVRDRMDLNGTSRLSPYLRFGMLSMRQAAVSARSAIEAAPTPAAAKSATTWLNELIWREFYQSILYHFPRVRTSNFQLKFNRMPWENNKAHFAAWCQGRTGYPVVDAAMRQLSHSGWMHNRARMIVASFLVKHLLIDWRWGERFFMQYLLDGDPAANNGGWQWTAGCGTDAAPYFRIFNPILQGKKFDPHGNYVRRWLPELANVPPALIHTPWEMSPLEQQAAGCRIGQHYPAPLVDHNRARDRALAAYNQVKG